MKLYKTIVGDTMYSTGQDRLRNVIHVRALINNSYNKNIKCTNDEIIYIYIYITHNLS